MVEREEEQLGDYQLLKFLGQGGFADVYLGEHTQLGTKAVIKLLYTHIVQEEVTAFQQQGRTLANLIHPNIVRVLDFGIEASTNTPYLTTDYIPGGTLRQRHAKGSRLPLPIVVSYVQQIAAALQYAHDEQSIHGAVKPENLLIGRTDELLLSDFGIVALSQLGRTPEQIASNMAGTPYYMAPEQIEAHPCPASDQYALGVVVYEWLCGKLPFSEGNALNIQYQHVHEPVPPLHEQLASISPLVEQVVLTALAKKPEERFGSVRAFATALEQASQDTRATPMLPEQAPISELTIPTVPLAQVITSTSAFTTQPAPAQDEVLTPIPGGISRRAVLLGVGGVVGLALLGTGIWWGTSKTSLLLAPTPTPHPSKPQGTLYLTYRGHSDAVFAVAWSPDGKHIASGSVDKTAQVWDAATGGNAFIYHGHSGDVLAVAWSPDSKRIASGSVDKTMQIWDAANGSHIFTAYYNGTLSYVDALAWSPDGKRIASGSYDKTVQVWNVATASHLFTYRGHAAIVIGVAWSRDSKRIASASYDGTVQIWDATNGGNILTYREHPIGYSIDALAWSPDGKRIASGGYDKTVQVWDAVNGGNVFIYRGHPDNVMAVTWSPDGKRIASASYDQTVQVWQA